MSENSVISDVDYNPFQSPLVESHRSETPPLQKPVAIKRIVVWTVFASVALAYGTLPAEFIPQLPRPQVPYAGLSMFSVCVAVTVGFASRGRVVSAAWPIAAVVFVCGWLLFLTVIHLASQSGIHRRDFKFIWPFVAASVPMTLFSTLMRNWRLTSDRQSGTEVSIESDPGQ